MSGVFETKAVGTEHTVVTAGFVVVRLQASPADRTVIAHGFVNNELVASASAADNQVPDVISTATQTFTMPVPRGSRFKIVVVAGTGVEVRWFPS